MSQKIYVEIVAKQVSLYPNQFNPITPETVIAYANALSDYPAQVVEMAFDTLARSSTKFPAVADVVGVIRDMVAVVNGDLSAYEAFDLVMRSVRNGGRYRVPELPERVQKALNGIGGYMYVCNSSFDEFTAIRSRFVSAYELETERAQFVALMPQSVKDLIVSGSQKMLMGKGQIESGKGVTA